MTPADNAAPAKKKRARKIESNPAASGASSGASSGTSNGHEAALIAEAALDTLEVRNVAASDIEAVPPAPKKKRASAKPGRADEPALPTQVLAVPQAEPITPDKFIIIKGASTT